MAIYRADGFTTLLLYFANKRMFLSKGLVTSVSGTTLSITNGTNTWTLEANS